VDLFDVVRSCIRRWYIVLPLLLIAAWFSYHTYTSVKPVYYSNAVVGLSSPNSKAYQTLDGSPVPQNGLMEVGGASMIANMVQIGLSDPSVTRQIVAAGGEANYTSKMFPAPANMPELPLIMIEATEPYSAAASKTAELVVAQADPILRSLQQQASVPDDQMVKALIVSPPSVPAAGTPSRTRSTIAIFVACAGLSILVGLVVDVLWMRWKTGRRKSRRTRVPTSDRAASADEADTGGGAGSDHPRNRDAAGEGLIDRR
jgi:hypothetical protein